MASDKGRINVESVAEYLDDFRDKVFDNEQSTVWRSLRKFIQQVVEPVPGRGIEYFNVPDGIATFNIKIDDRNLAMVTMRPGHETIEVLKVWIPLAQIIYLLVIGPSGALSVLHVCMYR
jgi:hypothetical protein